MDWSRDAIRPTQHKSATALLLYGAPCTALLVLLGLAGSDLGLAGGDLLLGAQGADYYFLLSLLSILTSAWAVVWLTLLFVASFFRFRFLWFCRISRKACVLLLLSILSWEAFNYATAEHDPLISLGLRWHLERTCSADYLQSWGENELARSRKGDICSPTPARIAALGAARDPANFTIEGEGPRSHVHIEWTTGGWGLFDDFEHWWLDVGPPSFVESARDVRPDFDVASPITVFKIRPGVYAGRGAEWDFP